MASQGTWERKAGLSISVEVDVENDTEKNV
jgi:hypothetical protein